MATCLTGNSGNSRCPSQVSATFPGIDQITQSSVLTVMRSSPLLPPASRCPSLSASNDAPLARQTAGPALSRVAASVWICQRGEIELAINYMPNVARRCRVYGRWGVLLVSRKIRHKPARLNGACAAEVVTSSLDACVHRSLLILSKAVKRLHPPIYEQPLRQAS